MELVGAYRLLWDSGIDSNLAQIQYLLKRGLDPNHQYFAGVTLFHLAASSPFDNIEVIRELINSGADVNFGCHLNTTPLHIATYYRKTLVMDELLQSGASVNAKDFLGKTALHHAVSRKLLQKPRTLPFPYDMSIINKLLKHESIDCNATDLNGETPLMLAVKEENWEIVVMLLENNADPNICNNDLETPLHVAFTQPLSYFQIELLFSGANIYSVNKNGETPMDILLKNYSNDPWNDYVIVILKTIAFKYSVTSDLKRKFEVFPQLSQLLNKCCDEVDHMRSDFIAANLTVHDFLWKCFDGNDFKFLLLQVHRPLIERLVRQVYAEYFKELLHAIPGHSLLTILQMTASLKVYAKPRGKTKTLADLFSILDVVYLFSKYLLEVDVFSLIAAFSDTTDSKPKQNLQKSWIYRVFSQKIYYW